MRALAWPDAFPATDIGVLKALRHALDTAPWREARPQALAALARLRRDAALAITLETTTT